MRLVLLTTFTIILCLCVGPVPVFAGAGSLEDAELLESRSAELGRDWRRESVIDASELLERAADLRLAERNYRRAVADLRESAFFATIANDGARAGRLFARALEVSRTNRSVDDEILVRCDLVQRLLESGLLDEAKAEVERFSRLRPTEESVFASMLFARAELSSYLDEPESSIKNYSDAAEILVRLGDIRRAANCYLSLGYAYLALNRFAESRRSFARSLEVSTDSANVRGVALANIGLGALAGRIDDKQAALDSYGLAERAFPDGLDLSELSALYSGLANVYESFGTWEAALGYREKALRTGEESGHQIGIAGSFWAAARANRVLGRNDAAISYLDSCIAKAAKLKIKSLVGYCSLEKGFSFLGNSQFQQAEKSFGAALREFEKIGNLRGIGMTANGLGRIHLRLGDRLRARKNFSRSLEIDRRIRDTFAEAEDLFQLARIDALDGNGGSALDLVRKSVEITNSLTNGVFNDRLRSTYVSSIYDRYELLIGLLVAKHREQPGAGLDVEALRISENSRARVLRERLGLAGLEFSKNSDPDLLRRARELRSVINSNSERLTELLATPEPREDEVIRIEGEISGLQAELDELNSQLKRSNPMLGKIKDPRNFDLATFQEQVTDDETIVLEFFLGAQESFLWTIRKGDVEVTVLPPRARIEERVDRLRDAVAARAIRPDDSIESFSQRAATADLTLRTEGRSLSEMLFSRIAPKLQGKKLIVVADGKLHYYPVLALPMPLSDRDDPLILTNQVIYAHSAASLQLLREKDPESVKTSKPVLVFSDPVFGEDDPRLPAAVSAENTEAAVTFRRLSGSAEEGATVARILGADPDSVLSGFQATRENAIADRVSEYRVIHFATHGVVDDVRPELSGIALSRFDHTGRKIDQMIRINDVFGLDLRAELVVLSACQTGYGNETRGEGIESLSTGFINAGARSVVASLWKVEDAAARQLMEKFYEELSRGQSTAPEALRVAQIELLKDPQFRSPYFWAAFTVQGDPTTKVEFRRRLAYEFLLPAVFVPFLILLLVLTRLKKRAYSNENS
ncbi:MAG: CHAT domain-containing protein [Acidobacteria bacterium]|nr:CHAT domain-containing protein [Acidobacteriota bacterium]